MGFIEEAVKLIISDKFAIVFKSFDNPNDLQQFKQHPRGTLFVFDNTFSETGKKCFMVCFVNRINRTIFYGTTQGDTVGCDFYQTLAQLNDNGNFFACTLFKWKCERSDELFVVHLCEIFTTGMIQYIKRALSDREIIQQYKLSFVNKSPQLTQESHRILRAIFKKEYSTPTQTNHRGPVYNQEKKPHYKSRTTYGWKDDFYYDDDDDEDMGESAPHNKHNLRDDFKSSSYSHRPMQRSY